MGSQWVRRLSRKSGAGALAAIFFGGLLLTACGGTSNGTPGESPKPLTKIKFAVAVAVPDPGQVFMFAPNGFGYFKKEGLDVEIVTNAGGGAALQQLASGNADFALSSPENFINGVGSGMDLKAFATVITQSIYSVGVLSSSPIKDYSQLKGKKIGISAFTSGAYPFAQTALAENGLDPKKDVQFVIIGTGGPAAFALKNGKVDVVVTTDTQWAIFKTLDVAPNFLPRPVAGKLPADQLVTRSETLKNNPGLCERFARAVLQGIIAALANPSKATDYYMAQYPDASAAQSKANNQAIMQARLDNCKLIPEQKGKWGFMNVELYQQVQEAGVKYTVIKTPQDLTKLMDNSLMSKIDAFDPNKVSADAKAVK
jgi:NitT/TauT family transport system substrate-binding protein